MVQDVYFTKLKRDTTPLLFAVAGGLSEGRDRGIEHLCVSLSLSLVKGHVSPPFRRAKFLSREYSSTVRPVSFSIHDRGIFDESIISRFSLISIHFHRFGCTMPLSLNEFLFLKRFS